MTIAAALLDRDGTINVKAAEGDYITEPDQLELLPGAAEAIGLLNDAGIPVIVLTNQRGVALGRLTESDLHAIHARLGALLAEHGAWVDEFLHCPHEAGTCDCRKPATGMLDQAREILGLDDLADAVLIGDSPSDVAAGRSAGTQVILVTPSPTGAPDVPRAPSLLEAVRRVLGPRC